MLTKQVQPPRFRPRYHILQAIGCLSLLLAFVFWASAFAKRLEEADERARAHLYECRCQDLEIIDYDWRRPIGHREPSASVLPDWDK